MALLVTLTCSHTCHLLNNKSSSAQQLPPVRRNRGRRVRRKNHCTEQGNGEHKHKIAVELVYGQSDLLEKEAAHLSHKCPSNVLCSSSDRIEEPVLWSFDFRMINVVIVIWQKDVACYNADLSEVQKSTVRTSWPIRPVIHDGVPMAVHHFSCLCTLKFTSLHVNQHAFPLSVLLLEADVVKPHITVCLPALALLCCVVAAMFPLAGLE